MVEEKHVHCGLPLEKPVCEDSLGIQIFDTLVHNADNRDILIDGITGERISNAQLLAVTCRLAESLWLAGYRCNDIISVSSENSLLYLQPIIAALYLGIIVAPINQNYIESELLHVLNVSKPKIIFCSRSVSQKFFEVKNVCPWLKRIIILDGNCTNSLSSFMDEYTDIYYDEYSFRPRVLDSKNQIAGILSSSGTTGLPKGVSLTHRNLSIWIALAQDSRIYKEDPNSTKLVFLPMFHSIGLTTTIESIILNKKTVILSRFAEDLFLKAIQDYKVNNFVMVPPIAILLAKSPNVLRYDLSSVKDITSSAAPLSKEIEELVKQRLPNTLIRQGYGMTETTLGIVAVAPGQSKQGSSGKVVPGMKVKVCDPKTGKALGPNEVGEMCIKGDMVMKGYYGNPEETKASFTEDGWLLSGDLAYFDEENNFFIVGRLKELIKYKGFQVPPAELEALLLSHPKIVDAGVAGLPDKKAGELPTAFVVKRPDANLTQKEVQEFVKKNVSNPKWLRGGVHFINAIPKSQAGKIIRKDLVQLAIQTRSKL